LGFLFRRETAAAAAAAGKMTLTQNDTVTPSKCTPTPRVFSYLKHPESRNVALSFDVYLAVYRKQNSLMLFCLRALFIAF
jgi:hypothetical protein